MAAATRTSSLAFAALLAMTAAWGSTFFLIKDLLTRLPVTDMLAVRFAVASVALLAVAGRHLRMSAQTARRGVLLGLLYGAGQILQTVGLAHTAASVSGFITGLYVVATPILAAVILRTRISGTTWLAVILATVGLGVLSLNGFALGYGELLTLVSALMYAGHILAMGRFSDPGTAMSLTLVQLIVITAICAMAAVPDGIALPATGADWAAMAYLAVVAGALTMFLQTWAQAHLDSTRAAVIMSMEPVWAAGFAVALGGELITARMVIGGMAILAAMYLVELAPRFANPPPAGLEPVRPRRDTTSAPRQP